MPLISESDVEVESGLGGRLDTLGLPLGGSGKPPMLVVLRTLFPGVGKPEEGVADGGESAGVAMAVLRVGTAGDERDLLAFGVGSPEVVTDRVIFGVGGTADEDEPGLESIASGRSGSALRVLGMGSAGSGPLGGASGELEGRRRPVEAMVVVVAVIDMFCCSVPSPPVQGGPSCDSSFAHGTVRSMLPPNLVDLLVLRKTTGVCSQRSVRVRLPSPTAQRTLLATAIAVP